MKKIKLLGFALALIGFSTLTQAQNEIRKEVNVEVENGEHVVSIITTDKNGKVTKEEYRGEEAKKKMHELHNNVPEGAIIEKEIIEETTDADGNEIIIRKSHSGEKGDMHWKHDKHPKPENRKEIHFKIEQALADLPEDERKMIHHQMRVMHHELSPESRKELHKKLIEEEIDIDVNEDNGEITIKIGDDVEVIKMDDMKLMEGGNHKMIFITDEEGEDGVQIKKEIIVITRNVKIEEDKTLQNDLKGIKFNTYPNPNNGHFNIELKLDGKTPTFFKISDLAGKEIHNGEIPAHKKGVHTLPVKMEEFEPGTYLIQILQGDKAATKRVIIQ